MIKWSFSDVTLVTEILFITAAHTDLMLALLKFWWCTNNTELLYLLPQTYLTEERNDYLTLESNTYENFPACVCFL